MPETSLTLESVTWDALRPGDLYVYDFPWLRLIAGVAYFAPETQGYPSGRVYLYRGTPSVAEATRHPTVLRVVVHPDLPGAEGT
jgi:hypothetical protein